MLISGQFSKTSVTSFQHVVHIATLITADKQIESEIEPCSRDVLKITVHGVITVNRTCTVYAVDDITNKIVGSVPELRSHVYSVIVCPAAVTSNRTECLYHIYITETRHNVVISNSKLTRTSVTILRLQSKFTTVSDSLGLYVD